MESGKWRRWREGLCVFFLSFFISTRSMEWWMEAEAIMIILLLSCLVVEIEIEMEGT